MTDRLHPDSIKQLRELFKLHGADALIIAIRKIEREGKDGNALPATRQKPTIAELEAILADPAERKIEILPDGSIITVNR